MYHFIKVEVYIQKKSDTINKSSDPHKTQPVKIGPMQMMSVVVRGTSLQMMAMVTNNE